MVFEVGYQERHEEFRKVLRDYIRENSRHKKPVMIGLEFDLDPDEMIPRLEEAGWRRNGSMGYQRLPVRPWDLDSVEEERVKELVPEDRGEMREDLEWRASRYFDNPSDMSYEGLWDEINKLEPEMAVHIWRKHHSEIQEYISDIAEKVFRPAPQRPVSGFTGEMREQMTPRLEEYEGVPEDVVRVIENTDQRSSRYIADTMSVTWMQVLDQELYRAGWMFEGKQLFTMYTPRDDGFVDFHQYVL